MRARASFPRAGSFAKNNAICLPAECHWSTLNKQFTLPCVIIYKERTWSTCWMCSANKGCVRHYICQANPRLLQLGVIPDCCYGLPVCLWYFRAGMLNSWSDQVLERNEVLWLPSFLGAFALRQEHLLPSSCPSVWSYISARLPLDEFLWYMLLTTFVKICRRIAYFGKIW